MISFLAAIIVTIVLSFFMIVAIKNIKEEVDQQIHKDIFQLSSAYFPIIDEKNEQLKNLKQEIERLQQLEATLQNKQQEQKDPYVYQVFIQEKKDYIDSNFFESYAFIQNEFQQLAQEAMQLKVKQLVRMRKDINVHEFKELLDLFDYPIQYEMYTLSAEEQLKVFEVISQNSIAKKRILNRYMKQNENFDFKAFMDYVRDYIYHNDSKVYIYSRDGNACVDEDTNYIVFCKDSSIAEGYKIKCKDQVYDYSLSGGRIA